MRRRPWIAAGLAAVVLASIGVAWLAGAGDRRSGTGPSTTTEPAPTTVAASPGTTGGEGSDREVDPEVTFPRTIRTMSEFDGLSYLERVELTVRDRGEGGLELVHEVDADGHERFLLERVGGGSTVELIVDGDDTYLRSGDGRWERSTVAGGILDPLAPLGIAAEAIGGLADHVEAVGAETREGRSTWRFAGGIDAIEAVLLDDADVTNGELTVWVDAELGALVGLSIELDAEGAEGPIRLEATYAVTGIGGPIEVEVPDA